MLHKLYEPFEAFEMSVEGSPPETRDKRCKNNTEMKNSRMKMTMLITLSLCLISNINASSNGDRYLAFEKAERVVCTSADEAKAKLLSDAAYIHICGDAKGMTQVVPLTHQNIMQEQLKTIPSEGRIGTGQDWIIKYHSNSEVIERATRISSSEYRVLKASKQSERHVVAQTIRTYGIDLTALPARCDIVSRCSVGLEKWHLGAASAKWSSRELLPFKSASHGLALDNHSCNVLAFHTHNSHMTNSLVVVALHRAWPSVVQLTFVAERRLVHSDVGVSKVWDGCSNSSTESDIKIISGVGRL
ncbi:hypothetical protein Tco_0241718 [Tanacetum coccineum]